MKKKTKNLLLLAVAMLLLLGGYLCMDLLPEKEEEEIETPVIYTEITEFAAGDVTSYSYKNAEYEMGFDITETGYVNHQDAEFPVNEACVELQLAAIGSLVALQTIDSTDKAEFGLDAPQITMQFTLKDGSTRSYSIGDKALFEEAYYFLDENNDKIYLISTELYEEFATTWSTMVKKETMIMPTTDQIVDVTVETDGGVTIYINYDEEMTYPWQITTPEGTFAGEEEAVLEALGAFSSYSIRSTVEYNCKDFSVYGLEQPTTKVTVRYAVPDIDGTITEEAKKNPNTLVFEFGLVDEENVHYVRINESSYVYGMSQYYAESISVFDLETLKMKAEEAVTE